MNTRQSALSARYDTLQELIKYCQEEMNKCEGEDRWVVIGKRSMHYVPIETEVKLLEESIMKTSFLCTWQDRPDNDRYQWVEKQDLENRPHLNTERYNAFKEMKEKLEKLTEQIPVI